MSSVLVGVTREVFESPVLVLPWSIGADIGTRKALRLTRYRRSDHSQVLRMRETAALFGLTQWICGQSFHWGQQEGVTYLSATGAFSFMAWVVDAVSSFVEWLMPALSVRQSMFGWNAGLRRFSVFAVRDSIHYTTFLQWWQWSASQMFRVVPISKSDCIHQNQMTKCRPGAVKTFFFAFYFNYVGIWICSILIFKHIQFIFSLSKNASSIVLKTKQWESTMIRSQIWLITSPVASGANQVNLEEHLANRN